MFHFRIHAIAILATATFALSAYAAPSWVESSSKSCADSCQSKDLFAVKSGTYQGSNSFFVCATNKNSEGFRPGFNLVPTWATSCTVGHGGTEHLESSYYCLCNDKNVPPPGK